MSYTKTEWENGATPAINADNLNKIENELEALDTGLSTHNHDDRYMRQGSTIGDRVNIKSFSGNTANTNYTCPSDGYVYFHRDGGSIPLNVTVVIGASSSSANRVPVAYVSSDGTAEDHTVFVKKGAVIQMTGTATSDSARNALALWFYPIS